MSPCCLSARGPGPNAAELEKAVAGLKAASDSASLPFFSRAQLATAAAWSPDPGSERRCLDGEGPCQFANLHPAVAATAAADAGLQAA
jgi:hypothetical protein